MARKTGKTEPRTVKVQTDDDAADTMATRLLRRTPDESGQVPADDKTRLIRGSSDESEKPGAEDGRTQVYRLKEDDINPVVGWLVVVDGPGRGRYRPIYIGMNSIGRKPDQGISLDFGDENISREEHAFLVYDDEQCKFFLQHGGKSSVVRLNGDPVMTPMQLTERDKIRIGATTLLFAPLCGSDFNWHDAPGAGS